MKSSEARQKRDTSGGTVARGAVLVSSLLILFVLSITMAALFRPNLAEYKGAQYFNREREAFYQAEGGIRYVMACIGNDMANGTMAFTNAVENVYYPAPANFAFSTVTNLVRLPDGKKYVFQIVGSNGNVQVKLEATVKRRSVFGDRGIFGGNGLELAPNLAIASYDSSTTTGTPTIAESTGEANVGSNGGIVIRPGVTIDGMIYYGDSSYMLSSYASQSAYVGQTSPDPLGAATGSLASTFTFYSSAGNNDNATKAAPAISGSEINLASDHEMSLSGGNYYLTGITMNNHCTLYVNGTPTNPVVIYLEGGANFGTQPNIVVLNNLPTAFYIFSRSSESIIIKPNNDFVGFVYAPYAEVELYPNGRIYGGVWAGEVDLKPGTELFIDTSVLGKFGSPQVDLVQWRQVTD